MYQAPPPPVAPMFTATMPPPPHGNGALPPPPGLQQMSQEISPTQQRHFDCAPQGGGSPPLGPPSPQYPSHPHLATQPPQPRAPAALLQQHQYPPGSAPVPQYQQDQNQNIHQAPPQNFAAPPPLQGYPVQQGYQAPPPQQAYQAPPQQSFQAPPPQQAYQAPPQQGYQAPPPQQAYQALPQQGYQAPPPQQAYQAPPQQGYQAPPPGFQAPQQVGQQQYAQQYQQHQAPPGQLPPQQQQLLQPVEDASVHTVTISKSATNGKIMNNGTIPRLTVDHREAERLQIPLAGVNPSYLKPTKLTTARTTFRSIPSTPQLAEQLSLPLGITIRPLGDATLPLVDFASMGEGVGVVRCKRCRAYINPYVGFTDGGRRWQCVMCRCMNECHAKYFAHINPGSGVREDLLNRPELCSASVEFVAPAEYMVRPPQRPIFLLLLDVSYNAVQSGMLRAQCEGALAALEQLKDDDSMHISVVAFDSTIYLFNLRSTLQAPKMIVAPDIVNDVVAVNESSLLDPVELPALPEDLIVCVKDSHHLVTQLLEKIPGMFANTKNVECAFGPALTTAISLLTPSGGKIIASISSVPSVGDGKLQTRTDKKLFHQPKEYTMTLPANEWYKQRALACSQAQISVDLLVNGAADVDLATIAPIARYTAGHIHRYSSMIMGGLRQQMERMLMRDTAFEAVLRVRAATGITVPNFYGHCYVRGPDLLALPMCDADSAYALQLQLTAPVQSAFAYVQVALLYTTRTRERRIRVHTVQLAVSNSIPRIFNSADVVATSTMLAKMTIDNAVGCAFNVAQQKITDRVTAGLKTFKKSLPNPGKYASSLPLPESLKALPFLLAGFFRNAATRFISTVETMPDDRVASQSILMTSSADSLLSYFSGTTYCLYAPRESLEVLPLQQLPTQETLKSDGIYLIDVGFALIVWYGKSVDSRVLAEFGFEHSGSSTLASDAVLSNGEEIAEVANRYRDIVSRLQSLSCSAAIAPVVACPQGAGPIERIAGVALVDDDVKEALSLGSYLSFLQRKVATE